MTKWTWAHTGRLILLMLLVVGLYLWHPGCVIEKTFGVECPTCGLSRGCFSLLHMNFAKAWRLNPLSYVCPLWGIWMVWGGRLLISGRANRVAFCLTVSLSVILLLFRLVGMLINT